MTLLERFAPWWGMLVVPGAFLTNLSVAYAVVPLACSTQHHGLLHIAPAIGLVITLMGLAWSGWSVMRLRGANGTLVTQAHRFLAWVGLSVAALFLLATLAQWYMIVRLSPC